MVLIPNYHVILSFMQRKEIAEVFREKVIATEVGKLRRAGGMSFKIAKRHYFHPVWNLYKERLDMKSFFVLNCNPSSCVPFLSCL